MTFTALSRSCTLSPLCPRCFQRTTRLDFTQIRGKKKNAKPRTTLNVRLVKDLPGFGRSGSIVPVPIGQMRNRLFPQRIANYVSASEAKDLKRDSVLIERDFNFGRVVPDTSDEPASKVLDPAKTPQPRGIDLELLPPDRAHELLERVVPPSIDFYRTPIGTIEERRGEAPKDAREESKLAAPKPTESPHKSPQQIYGSVSVADVTMAIKALLQSEGMSGLITLPDEDITFLAGDSDTKADRIKRLGEYEYEIKIKGHDQVITRSVRVLPDDGADSVVTGSPTAGPGITMGGPSDEEILAETGREKHIH